MLTRQLPAPYPSWHACSMRALTFLILLTLTSTSPVIASDKAVVREQRSFIVDGSKEIWRLVWRGAPRDSKSCGPAEPEMAMTCPCSGAAYAQVGNLILEREHLGTPPERMSLTPLFAGSDMVSNENTPTAMMVRWPGRLGDIGHGLSPTAIRDRRAVPIMRLRDYNHDGIAGEFLLQIDTLPCGKHLLVAVGITRDNPHLHALTSAEHPERPLALYQWQWDALARNPRPGNVVDWPCADHGAQEETTMDLRTEHGRIHATRITSTCPDTTAANGEWIHDAHFVKKVLKQEVM